MRIGELLDSISELKAENATLTLALAESLRNRTTEASWMVRLRDAEARAEKMRETISLIWAEAYAGKQWAFVVQLCSQALVEKATTTPPQQER